VNSELHAPTALPREEELPGTNWIESSVGPRPGLDAVAKRKESHHCLCREFNPGRPARGLVIILTELPWRGI